MEVFLIQQMIECWGGRVDLWCLLRCCQMVSLTDRLLQTVTTVEQLSY